MAQTEGLGDWVRRVFSSTKRTKRAVNDERVFVKEGHTCPSCDKPLDDEEFLENQYVCYHCDHHFRISINERMKFLADKGEHHEFSMGITSKNPIGFPDYEEKLKQAQTKTGNEDAIKNFRCHIDGREAVVSIMSFDFMGGSMGSVVGEKITQALLEGAENQLPVILFTASGGARMQEGIFSLMQMSKTSHAIALLETSGQPFIVVLTDPTTGGVTASFAMLGDIILAEPGSLIGFAGARVIEGIIKQKLPEGFQRAEFQQEKGFVDKVVNRNDLRRTLAFIIDTHKKVEGARK